MMQRASAARDYAKAAMLGMGVDMQTLTIQAQIYKEAVKYAQQTRVNAENSLDELSVKYKISDTEKELLKTWL